MSTTTPAGGTGAIGQGTASHQPENPALPEGKQPALRVMPMPADANHNGDIFGGWIMAQVDIAGGTVRSRLIEKVKTLLIERVQSGELPEHFSLVDFLGKALHRDYSAVSKLFTEVEGITLEQFFILQKIEKVKEWLVYNELSLSEIAFRLGYSSVAYLSSQFKKVTGMTPTTFKTNHRGQRRALDEVRVH